MEFTSKPAAQPPENPLAGITFTLDGEEFACNGEVRLFGLSAAAAAARRGDGAAEAALWAETLLMALGPQEFARFSSHVEEHDTPDDTVIKITEWIQGEAEKRASKEAGRPTLPQPSSSNGLLGRDAPMSRRISLVGGDVTVLRPGEPGYQAPGGVDLAALAEGLTSGPLIEDIPGRTGG